MQQEVHSILKNGTVLREEKKALHTETRGYCSQPCEGFIEKAVLWYQATRRVAGCFDDASLPCFAACDLLLSERSLCPQAASNTACLAWLPPAFPLVYLQQSFCFEHAVYQPTNVQRLFAAALDDGRSQSSAEDMGKWGDVAAALQLSEVQLGRLASARAQFVRSIGEVCAERRQIFERLQALTEEVPTSLRALQHVTATWLEVHEATADLTANMNQEHCVCMSFVKDAFGYTLSPRQKAVAIVRSFPFFPDMYSVSTAALGAQHPAQLAGPQPAGLLTAATASQ